MRFRTRIAINLAVSLTWRWRSTPWRCGPPTTRPGTPYRDELLAAAHDDLSGRVSLEGPKDEIREMADTFDVMLDRIAPSFEVQRRFSAQVSHELRTPLALMRTEIDMLVDDLDDAELRGRLGRVAEVTEVTERADRLVAQLSVLARVQAGDLTREVFGLDEMVGNVVGRAMEAPSCVTSTSTWTWRPRRSPGTGHCSRAWCGTSSTTPAGTTARRAGWWSSPGRGRTVTGPSRWSPSPSPVGASSTQVRRARRTSG
jgi:hypothetical protein